MLQGIVLVPDVVEEVDLVLWREEACADAVNGRVAPALQRVERVSLRDAPRGDVDDEVGRCRRGTT